MRACSCICFLGPLFMVWLGPNGVYVSLLNVFFHGLCYLFYFITLIIVIIICTIAIGRFVTGVHGLYHRIGLTETIPQ